MHHVFSRRQLPRLFVFVFATLVCLAMVQWPEGPAPRRVASDPVTGHVRDLPHAAASPGPSEEPSTEPVRTLPGRILAPLVRRQARATVDRKNIRHPVAAPARPRARRTRPAVKARARLARPSRSALRKPARPQRPWVPGQDISWPQCGSQPMPYDHVRFVVIGLTDGKSFTRNPCLARHLAWARRHHTWTAAYAFTTFPRDRHIATLGRTGPYDGRHWLGRVQNAAWKTALFNVRTLREHGFVTPHVWIDVEASSSRPWTGNKAWNRAVLAAWTRAYRSAGYGVGVYSSRSIWHGIMGTHRPRLPEWRTAGPASARAALARCRESSFQGGHGVLAQWWDSRRDYDRMCPGFQGDRAMRRYFAKY